MLSGSESESLSSSILLKELLLSSSAREGAGRRSRARAATSRPDSAALADCLGFGGSSALADVLIRKEVIILEHHHFSDVWQTLLVGESHSGTRQRSYLKTQLLKLTELAESIFQEISEYETTETHASITACLAWSIRWVGFIKQEVVTSNVWVWRMIWKTWRCWYILLAAHRQTSYPLPLQNLVTRQEFSSGPLPRHEPSSVG